MEFYQDAKEIKKNSLFPSAKYSELFELLKKCDGIGVSGANENSNSVLNYYSKIPKIRAIHSAETKQSITQSKKVTGKSETIRALTLKPDFLVHMTYASKSDLKIVSKKARGIVICPRANSSLAEGIPDIDLMQKSGCILALGTDNVMINSPDMFREMDFIWKVTMGLHKKRIDAKEILKMATVNGGKILNKNVGSIESGQELEYVSNTDVRIQNNKFKKIHSKIKPLLKEESVDCEGLLMMPGFINAHTHIGDSVGKDISLNSTIDEKIHPVFGVKSKILKNTSKESLS